MKAVPLLRSAITLTACVLAANTAMAAEDAASVIKHARAAMANVKSVSSEWLVDVSAGTHGAMSFKMKTAFTGRKYRVEIAPIGQATGEYRKFASLLHLLVVSNGHVEYHVVPGEYSKGAPDRNATNMWYFMPDMTSGEHLMLRPLITIAGRPTYVLEGTSGKGDDKSKVSIYIDRATYQPKRIVFSDDNDNNPTRLVCSAVKWRTNAHIPARLFRYTPPAGYHEDKWLLKGEGDSMGTMVASLFGASKHSSP